MSIIVGEVIAVKGIKISIRVFEDSNKDTLFYDGEKYKGISIQEHVKIERGFRSIICIVEGEYLDERLVSEDKQNIRIVELKPVGYFERGIFFEGIKHLPLIKDSAYLLEESKLFSMYSKNADDGFSIGRLLKEDLPISLPWQKIFNTHIGIFGNTGSGKSNTLTNLYTTLFDNKIDHIKNKSKFVVIDFNGEYTTGQLTSEDNKTVYNLNTQEEDDKFPLSESEFWDVDTLSLLFQATPSTQKPFINRVVRGKINFKGNPNAFLNYIKKTYEKVFTTAGPAPELLDLIREVTNQFDNPSLTVYLDGMSYHGGGNKFCNGRDFFDANGDNYRAKLKGYVDALVLPKNFTVLDEFAVRCDLQLIQDLILGFVQFDFIQPLLKRMQSSLSNLTKVLEVTVDDVEEKTVTIISLRKCNQDIKKVLPLLIAKHYYNPQRRTVENPPNKTVHLIIDEAHNVLSQQSTREHDSWRDYRLETFEEIIKEGRKFGVFLTLSSQRPADISPTIISQLHNFFIHRLVNERDLMLLDNTISTLDSLSRSMIPNLAKGSCVITGTSFDLPLLIQVNELPKTRQPDSEDVDLDGLWKEE